jgi:hypothetical protein
MIPIKMSRRQLEPTPHEKEPRNDLALIISHLNTPVSGKPVPNKPADMETYKALVGDRPAKFNAVQVGFKEKGGDSEGSCGKCVHHYISKASDHKVCEILRLENDKNIEPEDVCLFQSADGKTFPRLKT